MNQTSESNGRTGWPIVLIAASLLLVLGRDLLDNNRQQAALKLTVARQEEGVAKSRDVAKGFEKMMRDLLQLAQTDTEAKAIVAKYGIAVNAPPAARPK